MSSLDVRVDEIGAFGLALGYRVIVDGAVYDSMSLLIGPSLTWAQMRDMEDMYREALTGYEGPGVK